MAIPLGTTIPVTDAAGADAGDSEVNRILRNPTFINFLDGCALSVPCHVPGSAPAGLMLAAAGGRDRAVLALGMAVEACLRRA